MTKLLQNKVAESKLALPVTALYATIVWLLGGLVMQQWWLQPSNMRDGWVLRTWK